MSFNDAFTVQLNIQRAKIILKQALTKNHLFVRPGIRLGVRDRILSHVTNKITFCRT